jgi:hypothetical protein
MKRNIFLIILTFVVSIGLAFGQALPGTAPRPIACDLDNPLTPVAGIPYEYQANVTPESGMAYWYATTSTQFMAGGSRVATEEAEGGSVVAAADNYMTNLTNVTNPTGTEITWTTQGLAAVDASNPLFVVIEYTADATNCSSNNMKVYRIQPINAFVMNVLNLGLDFGALAEQCYDEVQDAEYDLANNIMVYDFGENVMAFEVIAANFTGSYTPSFRIDGIQNGQEVEVLWSYTNDFSTGISLGTILADDIVAGTPVSTDVTNTSLGVSIFVWLVVSHNNYEGLDNDPITFAVAGVNSASQPNVRWDDCNIAVVLAADLSDPSAPDYAIHTLQARPTVTPGAGLDFELQTTP